MSIELLNQKQIEEVTQIRQSLLIELKDNISRKFYYALEEKLEQEKKSLSQILDWQEGRNTELSKYSLVLDPHYFEQEFLN